MSIPATLHGDPRSDERPAPDRASTLRDARSGADGPERYSPRRKLAIILVGALAAWALMTGLAQIVLTAARALF